MIYLVLGPDGAVKDQKIAELKAKAAFSSEALLFDYDNLDACDTDVQALRKTLLALPVAGAKRLVVLRNVHKLDASGKEALLQFLTRSGRQKRPEAPSPRGAFGRGEEDQDIILESGDAGDKNPFLKKLAGYAQVTVIPAPKQQNVFDMTNALSARDPAGACKILDSLLSQGDHPLQIMGGLVWFWGKSRSGISGENFHKGLVALEEADLNIKRSRLKPEQALELLVVKLSGMI
ncbi:MAG: hypothetical protein HZA28_02600 [Candidatus Omnitrophica bacterium]|nr:hypothetical protein [Candidatus Omnitrophota bacterium]